MGNCFCKSKKQSNASGPPVVAVIGSTGYVGKCLMSVLLEGLRDGKLKQLRVLTVEENLNSPQIQLYLISGAKAVAVDYKDVTTVTKAFNGVDAVVSALGISKECEEVRTTLLDALVAAQVKLYFPSEFGTNHYHYKLTNYIHPLFEGKRKHFMQAQERGLNPIRMLTGAIMESSFGKCKWFELDTASGVWTVVGNSADIPCAVTAERDMARFTLEAILLAHSDISKCPNEIEVFSDKMTLREYAKLLDKVTGRETKIERVPLEEFKAEYEKSEKPFVKLLKIMLAERAFDFANSTGNQLLNPNETVWKLKKFQDYAEETGGAPWKDFKD